MTKISRRSFLQAAVAASAVGATVPRWLMPAGAQPLAADQGMLLVVHLGGGCDGLSVLVPSAGERRAAYDAARGSEALPAASLLPATVDHGFNPAMPSLAARFAQGDVALIDGVGLPVSLRSHSLSTIGVQAASTTPLYTGWVGRHLDGHVDRGDELMSVAVDSTVPLVLKGEVSKGAALPPGVGMWGADTSGFELATADAVRAFADSAIGRGPWAELIASTGSGAIDAASLTAGLSTSSRASGYRREAEIAAHILNADIGTQVVGFTAGGFDTHAGQNGTLTQRLALVDQAIEGFFATLSPELHNRTLVLVTSEFGRKPAISASLGTDHGYAGLSMLIGPNVAGGLHSEPSSLTALDDQGCLVPTVDLRRLYATIIDGWFGGDSNAVLGGTFAPLPAIAAAAGTNA